jgi:NADPH:quinone reductase-like Zn-dependent oxidoreductase
MKASVVTAYGGQEVMDYQDMPDAKPGAGDVLVGWPASSKRKCI